MTTTLTAAWQRARPGGAVVLGLVAGWLVADVRADGAPGLWYAGLACAPLFALLGAWWPQPGSARRQGLAYRVLVAFDSTVINLGALAIAVTPVVWIASRLADGPSAVLPQCAAVVMLGGAALLGGLSLRGPLERLTPRTPAAGGPSVDVPA